MTIATAIASRVLSATRNENLLIASARMDGNSFYLEDAKTQSKWAMVIPNASLAYEYAMIDKDGKRENFADFKSLVSGIKSHRYYPAPKVREPRMVAKHRRTAQTTGVSMGRFVPGLLASTTDA